MKNTEYYALVMKVRECPILGFLEGSSDDRKFFLNANECHCTNQDARAPRFKNKACMYL